MALAIGTASNARAGEGEAWSVSKSSGEVWMTTTGAQQVSLGQQDVLKPGDTIRTGRNGRVLLVRGEETILVSPNSVVGLPTEKRDGLSTTIVQQAGSILLEVEKRNVKHFEVETPYLAAVVKGTQFRVSVNETDTRIDVIRGQVEVADFRSGQIAQVLPGQAATAFAHGKPGLSMSGTGSFSPIEQGRPRASSIERVMVPKTGLAAPRHAANGQLIRALGDGASATARSASHASGQPQRIASSPGHGVTRISASLGEVRLNFHKVTHGLARGGSSTPGTARNVADKDTVWASHEAGATTSSAASGTSGSSSGGNSGSSNGGNSGSSYGGNSGNAGIATAVNVATGVTAGTISGVTGIVTGVTGNNGNGNGNGNNGANGNGNNGKGHAYGHYK
jgi:FecR protein